MMSTVTSLVSCWMAIGVILMATSLSTWAFVPQEQREQQQHPPIFRRETQRMSMITSRRKSLGMMMMTTKTMISSRHNTCLFQRPTENVDDNDNKDDNKANIAATSSASSLLYTKEEIQEMTNLIVSLSLEVTDHDRRMRVKEVFVEALARPNGMPQRFCDLFDNTLTQVGDQVQANAKKKFFEQQQQQQQQHDQNDDRTENDVNVELAIGNDELRLKSPEELQLWALVDMMVQSKTIVKKRNGELGSKGTFR
jgi:hypothetical protein